MGVAAILIVLASCAADDPASESDVVELATQKYGGDEACVREAVSRIPADELDGIYDLMRDDVSVSGFEISDVAQDALSDLLRC